MQIASFLAHYQIVYINFDLSSFFLISCMVTVALLQACLAYFRPVFSPQIVSIRFKVLIVCTLKTLLKIAYLKPDELFGENIARMKAEKA